MGSVALSSDVVCCKLMTLGKMAGQVKVGVVACRYLIEATRSRIHGVTTALCYIVALA